MPTNPVHDVVVTNPLNEFASKGCDALGLRLRATGCTSSLEAKKSVRMSQIFTGQVSPQQKAARKSDQAA